MNLVVSDSLYPIPPEVEPVNNLKNNGDFIILALSGLVSDIGSSFTFIASLFLVLDITLPISQEFSAQAVALVTIFRLIPTIFIGPFAGVFVDRYDRKKILIISELFSGLSVLVLFFVHTLVLIYSVVFIGSTIYLFFSPAKGASIPQLVETDQIVRANSVLQTELQVSSFIGPALAGTTIGLVGLKYAFLIDAISYLLSAFILLFIKRNLKPTKSEDKLSARIVVRDLNVGFQAIKNDRVILFVLITFLFSSIAIGMINPVLAFYLEVSFKLNAQAFGYLLSYTALIGIVTAIIFSLIGHVKHKLTIIILGLFFISVSIVLLGFAPSLQYPVFWLYLSMTLIGSVNVLINIPISSLFQTLIDNKKLGKVSAFMNTGFSLAQAGGAVVVTTLILYYTISNLLILTGISLIFIVIISYLFMRLKALESESMRREEEILLNNSIEAQ